jgi:hypothetical protein
MDPAGDQSKLYGLVQFKCTKQYNTCAKYLGPRKEKRS